MKKVICLILVCLTTLNVRAQSDSERMGDTAFSLGNYADAIELYKAATTISKDRTSIIQSKRSKASKCLSLRKSGDSSYASYAYEESKAIYKQLLSLNPSDKHASDRLNGIDKLIAKKKAEKNKEAAKKKEHNAYLNAIKAGDIASLQKFTSNYPKSEYNKRVEIIINFSRNPQHKLSVSDIPLYNSIGKDYTQIHDKTKARMFYDYSAALADPEGLYLKAMSYNSTSSKSCLDLLALAASGGNSNAKAYLTKTSNDSKYNKVHANKLYNALKSYRTELSSFMLLCVNKASFPIDRLDLKELGTAYLKKISYETNINPNAYDDCTLYQLSKLLIDQKINSESLMIASASKGNLTAISWLKSSECTIFNQGEKMVLERYLNDYQSVKCSAYVKYMKDEPMQRKDWYNMKYYTRDFHEELIGRSLSMSYNFEVKYFKQLLTKRSTWDCDVLEYIKKNVATYSPKYAKKIVKRLSKLDTMKGIYSKDKTTFYAFAQHGFFDNPHSQRDVVYKLVLWNN